MKKNLKINLKRLTSGFISSVMMMSFILMPIPNVSVVYAETNEDGVVCPDEAAVKNGAIYVPGCKLEGALSQTKMENSLDNQKAWKGIVEQAVSSMMGVVLLDNMFYKYMYAYDHTKYGNDCPQNKAATYTIRGAQLGALAYIIGEIKSNTKYKKLAKEATDLEFAGKAKVFDPGADSTAVSEAQENNEENPHITALANNNKQITAYETLIEVLKQQKSAIKTKIIGSSIAEGMYVAVEVAELLNILKCNGTCTKSYGKIFKKLAPAVSTGGAAVTGMVPVVASSALVTLSGMTPKSCLDMQVQLPKTIAEVGKKFGENQAKGQKKAVKTNLKDKLRSSKFFGYLGKIADMFKPSKVKGESGVTMKDLPTEIVFTGEEAKKVTEDTKEQIEDKITTQKEVQTVGQQIISYSRNALQCDIGLKRLLTTAQATEKLALTAKTAALSAETAACAGPQAAVACAPATAAYVAAETYYAKCVQETIAANTAQQAWKAVRPTIDSFIGKNYEWVFARTQCCGFKGISTIEAQSTISSLSTTMSASQSARFTNTTTSIQSVYKDMTKIISTYSPGLTVPKTAIGGTFAHVGLSPKSSMAKRSDIQIIPLIKKKSSMFDFSNRPKEGFTLDVVLPAVVENKLYEHGLKNFVNWRHVDKTKTVQEIANVDREIKKVSQEIKKHIYNFQNPVGPVLANHSERKSEFMKNLRIALNKFNPISSAQAQLSGGMAKMGIGLGMGFLAKKLGGPWGEILNVGSKYMILNGLLKQLGVELFTKPRSRALTWAGMAIINGAVISFQVKASEEVQTQLEVMEAEFEKFKNSGASGTGFAGNRSGMGRDSLRNSKYGKNQLGKMNIKSCVVASGDTFLPKSCPSLASRDDFKVKELNTRLSNEFSPSQMKNLSLLSDGIYGATSSDTGGYDNLSSGDLDKIGSLNNAFKAKASELRDKVDKDDNNNGIDKKFKSESLANMHAKFRKVFNGSGNGSSGVNFGSGSSSGSAGPLASTKPTETLGTGNVVSGGGSGGGGSAPVAAMPSFDLDFGDEGEVAVGSDAIGAAKSAKKTEKLGDFVMKHNDINKRKDISIFKILSNRYILSYPKVLEEETVNK